MRRKTRTQKAKKLKRRVEKTGKTPENEHLFTYIDALEARNAQLQRDVETYVGNIGEAAGAQSHDNHNRDKLIAATERTANVLLELIQESRDQSRQDVVTPTVTKATRQLASTILALDKMMDPYNKRFAKANVKLDADNDPTVWAAHQICKQRLRIAPNFKYPELQPVIRDNKGNTLYGPETLKDELKAKEKTPVKVETKAVKVVIEEPVTEVESEESDETEDEEIPAKLSGKREASAWENTSD